MSAPHAGLGFFELDPQQLFSVPAQKELMDDFQLNRTLDALQVTTARLATQHAALNKRFDRLQAAHQGILDRVLTLEQFTLNNYIEKENQNGDSTSTIS